MARTAKKPAKKAADEDAPKAHGHRHAPGAFWSGTLTFGLVSVPVELHAAHRSSAVSLRSLGPEGRPLRRRYVCPAHETPVDRDEIVRGYEVDDGRFVTVTDDELDALQPERSREIDLRLFTPRASIDPVYCDRAYFLLPPDEISKPYRLLAATMERTGRAGIATFVMRGRPYTIAIFAERGVLRAETLRQADEVRSADDVGLPAVGEADPAQVKSMRAALRAAAADEIDRDALRDVGAEALRALAAKKAKAGDAVVEPALPDEPDADDDAGEGGEVIDIMALLKQRLGAGKGKGKGKAKSKGKAASKPASGTRSLAAAASKRKASKASKASKSSDTPESLGALTKKELYARAQAADIEGRSAMSKDELVDALAS